MYYIQPQSMEYYESIEIKWKFRVSTSEIIQSKWTILCLMNIFKGETPNLP